MLDGKMRRLIDPPFERLGGVLAGRGITANQVTLAGLLLGIAAAAAIALQNTMLGLGLILCSRLADGLDGAIARHRGSSEFGGYLDIVCDFLFYGLVPLGFVLADPADNAVAGAVLLASFYFNGATFLGYAILAEKRRFTTQAGGIKSFYFASGLLEGTETILFFVAFCLWPAFFPVLAYAFASGCLVTGAGRILLAFKVFR